MNFNNNSKDNNNLRIMCNISIYFKEKKKDKINNLIK